MSHDLSATVPTLDEHFFQPLSKALISATATRACPSFSDDDWLRIAVLRVMQQESSGRGIVQHVIDHTEHFLPLSTYFDAATSSRRLRLLNEVSDAVGRQVDARLGTPQHDPFADIASLNDYDIYAGDGHYLEMANRDTAIDGTRWATGHFFGANLRSHRLIPLTVGEQGGEQFRKKEHDMRALKRLGGKELRLGAPTGRRVVWVWDRAGIDATQWQRWKQAHGVYFVSRAKENMRMEKMGDLPYDPNSPLNTGVTDFQLVSIGSQALRHVVYQCPETDQTYHFISSLTQVEPGVIAALYRARWDIEKIFDETKTKLRERKSWGSKAVTKDIQAAAVALTHNLMMLLEHDLLMRHQLQPTNDIKLRSKRLEQAKKRAESRGAKLSPLVVRLYSRATQRGLRFIRWLRNHLSKRTPLTKAIGLLRHVWASS